MSKPVRTANTRRVYEFVRAHRKQYPVEVLCRVLDVAPSGY